MNKWTKLLEMMNDIQSMLILYADGAGFRKCSLVDYSESKKWEKSEECGEELELEPDSESEFLSGHHHLHRRNSAQEQHHHYGQGHSLNAYASSCVPSHFTGHDPPLLFGAFVSPLLAAHRNSYCSAIVCVEIHPSFKASISRSGPW